MTDKVENLRALVEGYNLNPTQRALAKQEMWQMLEKIQELQEQSKNIDALHGVSYTKKKCTCVSDYIKKKHNIFCSQCSDE